MTKGIFVIVLSLIGLSSLSQTSILEVSSNDSSTFFLFIDDVLIEDTLNFQYQLELKESNEIDIAAKLNLDSNYVAEKSIQIETSSVHTYQLMSVANQLIFAFSGSHPINFDLQVEMITQEVADSESTRSLAGIDIKTPRASETSDSLFIRPLNIGCPSPMSSSAFNRALQTVESKSFQKERKKLVKEILNSNCLSSTDFQSLIETLEYEDDKLEIVKASYSSIYDIDNFPSLKNVFLLNTNQNEFNQFLQDQNK